MIGAKLAHPDKFCLNMMGDGAFGMSGLDLETSARAGIPITTVLLNNGGMATYPGGFPVARERYGVSYMQGNYAQIAEGMGAVGTHRQKSGRNAPRITRSTAIKCRWQNRVDRCAYQYGEQTIAVLNPVENTRCIK